MYFLVLSNSHCHCKTTQKKIFAMKTLPMQAWKAEHNKIGGNIALAWMGKVTCTSTFSMFKCFLIK